MKFIYSASIILHVTVRSAFNRKTKGPPLKRRPTTSCYRYLHHLQRSSCGVTTMVLMLLDVITAYRAALAVATKTLPNDYHYFKAIINYQTTA